jgi:hypothetical protein
MWAAEELVIDRGTGRKSGPSLRSCLTFSFLIVRGAGLPRVGSVRRNLFGWRWRLDLARAGSDGSCQAERVCFCDSSEESFGRVFGLVDGFSAIG